jgi:capsular polysaccharide export protein
MRMKPPRDVPLLRAPPFPGDDVTVTLTGHDGTPGGFDESQIDCLFAAIRTSRVGGSFWAKPSNDHGAATILRPSTKAEVEPLLAQLDEAARNMALCVLPTDEVDPWSLLQPGVRLFAHGDDEWAAIGHIAGCQVDLLSAGRFGASGGDLRLAVATDLFARRYRNPFTGEHTDVEATVAQLAEWRRILDANRPIVAACGMAWWKRHEISRFLWTSDQPLRFLRSERRAIAHAARIGGSVAVWPSRISAGMAETARRQGVPLVRVEDGFVRSVGLGSDLVPPSSVAVDRLGIHYDPSRPSDLEAILAEAAFSPELLARAQRLREIVVASGISKYGGDGAHRFPPRLSDRRLVLVPGQVEDDMSVQLGGGGLSSNLELLRRARALEPEAEIWFRPHPDVDAGHRKGAVRDSDARAHADRIVRGGGMAGLLDLVDGVHVLTSLTGFEALLRGRDVTCHGMPFYAGWGLTRDLASVPERRGRVLTLDQLVAAVLIVYPRYLDPATGLPCPPEVLVRRMADGPAHNRLGWVTRIRQLQGRMTRRRV